MTATLPPTSPAHRRRSPWRRRVLAVTGTAALVAAGALVWNVHRFDHHAYATSRRLAKSLMGAAHPPHGKASSCSAPPLSGPAAGAGARMVLSAPAIGLSAPVVAGSSEASLAVAVGHLPTSAWPGQGGTDVLEAHDVTFFAGIDRLAIGDELTLEAPCQQWTYRVTGLAVDRQGTPVANQAAPSLVLVTCWPTNALFFTRRRFVVTSRLVATRGSDARLPAPPSYPVPEAGPLPAGVTPSAVSVDTLGIPEGTLGESAGLAAGLRDSASALATTNAAMQQFGLGLLAAERGDRSWWSAAGDLPLSAAAPLIGASPVWLQPADVTLGGVGDNVASATVSGALKVGATDYSLNVGLQPRSGRWTITSWRMSPPA